MQTSNRYLVYMTAGSRDEARTIGRVLVESRLAACVNILDNMTSLYSWEGRVQEDREVVLIAKTTADRFSALKEKVTAVHSYDCPWILGFQAADGHAPFLDWIRESVVDEAVC